jgi:hypothetical protein
MHSSVVTMATGPTNGLSQDSSESLVPLNYVVLPSILSECSCNFSDLTTSWRWLPPRTSTSFKLSPQGRFETFPSLFLRGEQYRGVGEMGRGKEKEKECYLGTLLMPC